MLVVKIKQNSTHMENDMILKKSSRLIAKTMKLAIFSLSIVAMFMVAFLVYYMRNHRIIAEFVHGDSDVVVVMDGKAIPVDVFVDCTNTVFYYVDRDGDKSCKYSVERRLILVLRGKLEITPPPFVVSRHGIGVLHCIPDVYSCLGTRILTGPESMNFADDVQDDMKGLDAVVETRRDDSSVEYSIVGRWRGRREIVIKINSNLHDYICGVGRRNEEE